MFLFCSKPAMDPNLICGNAQVLIAQHEHLLWLPLPWLLFCCCSYECSHAGLLPAPWTSIIIWLQGLYIGSLSPTCLLYNTLSSFGSLLRTYLLQKPHFYHSIYFCNYPSPKPDHSVPIYPDLLPPLLSPHFLTFCMIPLLIVFIIHFLSTCIRK